MEPDAHFTVGRFSQDVDYVDCHVVKTPTALRPENILWAAL